MLHIILMVMLSAASAKENNEKTSLEYLIPAPTVPTEPSLRE
jgi:hypothetical protein